MFAHSTVKSNIMYKVHIIAVGDIICLCGQTSFTKKKTTQLGSKLNYFAAKLLTYSQLNFTS